MNRRIESDQGFTLIELLVVVAIITMLIAILLPSLGGAKDRAKETVCGTNLRQWTTAAVMFAGEHRQHVPMAFHPGAPGNASKHVFPRFINRDEGIEVDQWKTYGTNWQTWQKYGLTHGVAACPSRPSINDWYDAQMHPISQVAYWGKFYRAMNYIYLGGVTADNAQNHTLNPLRETPVVNMTDRNPSRKILITDDTSWVGPGWGEFYVINHTRTGSDVTFQATGYADGHVEGRNGGEIYPGGIDGSWPSGDWGLASGDQTVLRVHAMVLGRQPVIRRRRQARGFTLIELLVVVAIITTLIAILLPSLGKSKEQTRRVVCGSNLHQWGVSCFSYSASFRGALPMGFRHWTANVPRLQFLNAPNAGDTTAGGLNPFDAARFGLPWSEFKRFGMIEGLVDCPSATWQKEPRFAYIPATWGRFYSIDYLYIVGAADLPVRGNPVVNTQRHAPQPAADIKGDSNSVIAADAVYWGGGAAYAWGNGYAINHTGEGSFDRPEFQNVLYADGRVGTVTGWDNPLENDLAGGDNYSFKKGSQGSFYYWEGTADR